MQSMPLFGRRSGAGAGGDGGGGGRGEAGGGARFDLEDLMPILYSLCSWRVLVASGSLASALFYTVCGWRVLVALRSLGQRCDDADAAREGMSATCVFKRRRCVKCVVRVAAEGRGCCSLHSCARRRRICPPFETFAKPELTPQRAEQRRNRTWNWLLRAELLFPPYIPVLIWVVQQPVHQ